MPNYRELMPTIDLVYGAALDLSGWPRALGAVVSLFEADNAFICQEENRRRLFDYVSHSQAGRDSTPVGRYEHLMAKDPRRRAFDASCGRPVACRMAVSTDELHASAAYRDYLSILGIEYTMVVSLPDRPGFTHDLGIVRGRHGRPFEAADIDLLGELVPHLARAFEVRRRLHASGAVDLPARSGPAPALGELDRVRHGLRLPPAQARLALAIASGRTVRQAAADLGLTEASARQYLRRIFDATGVRRQADLVRVVGQALAAG